MQPGRRIRLSKFLSLILRHRPEQVGLVLDAQPGPAVRPPEWLYPAMPAAELERVRTAGLRPERRQ